MDAYFYIEAVSPASPGWVQVASALLTPIVAIFGVYIARQQWLTARSKLNFDLFEKRYKIYSAAEKIIYKIIQNGSYDNSDFHYFMRDTKEARWLFNEEVHAYIRNELYDAILRFDSENQRVYDNSSKRIVLPDADLAEAVRLRRELLLWIADQPKVLEEKLSDFMKI